MTGDKEIAIMKKKFFTTPGKARCAGVRSARGAAGEPGVTIAVPVALLAHTSARPRRKGKRK